MFHKSSIPDSRISSILFLGVFIFISRFLNAQEAKAVHNLKYWSPERTYVFEVVYSNNTGKVLSNETITLQPTGTTWTVDAKQTLVTFSVDYSKTDTSQFGPYLANGLKPRFRGEFMEGVIEKKERVWMHPLRQNQYCLTEIAPFPEILLPPLTAQTWSTGLSIYSGWKNFEGTVKNEYRLAGREARKYSLGTLACWKVEASGVHDKLGESKAEFYFNTELGFTEMNYIFYNAYTLSIKIKEFVQR